MLVGVTECCCRCWRFADDFNRADNDDPGGAYAEVAGDSDIASNRLWQSAGGPTILVRSEAIAFHGIVIYAEAPDRHVNETYRVLACYADADNYLCGEYAIDGSGTATIKIIKRTAGVESTVAEALHTYSDGLTGTRRFRFCVHDEETVFCVADVEGIAAWSETGYDPYGGKIGLANSGANAIVWDNFAVWEHYLANHKDDCPYCLCFCQDRILPKTLYAVLSGTGACADCVGEFTLTPQYYGCAAQPKVIWRGYSDISCGATCEKWCVEVGCADAGFPEAWIGNSCASEESCLEDPDNLCNAGNPMTVDEDASDCSPLNLIYTLTGSVQVLLCCLAGPGDRSITLTITETAP